MKIGIDLVSGESSLELLVKGSFDALSERKDFTVVYFGRKDSYLSVFNGSCKSQYEKFKHRIEIVEAPEVIGMKDDPFKIIKQKKESSIIKGIQYHKDGKIDAFFSPGNTGAIVVASSIMLGRIKGIKKPALASVMPTVQGNSNLLIDVGASAECEADDLLKFAIMGDIYTREVMGIENPKVGLLNIGEEEHKGNKSIKDAYKKFSEFKKIDFYGNVEGYEIFADIVQVIVCDGYIGNIALKVAEGTAKAINSLLKQSIKSNLLSIISLPLFIGALKTLKAKMDPEKYGGAPLLGVNGNVFIGHGKSGRDAIKHGILVATKAIDHDVLGKLTNGMKDLT